MFTDYNLNERVLQALERKGFTTPTAIQEAALPHALEGKDVLGQARTGTGKTLAFALPIANRLEEDRTRGRTPRALILTPTRELALQVAGEVEWVAHHLTVVAVYGGTGYGAQAGALKRGADVIVATPGRAIDYHKQGVLDLSAVQIAVLDEADEMLSMGFEEDVETLLQATPSERQTMLFSATMPNWASKLSQQHLKDPVQLNMMREEGVSYEEIAIEAPLAARVGILSDVLFTHARERAIVFTRTKAEVDELAKALGSRGHSAEAVHGDLNQVQRERVLERFRSGQATVLVATNVAARGLDIPEVDLVVHFRIPEQSESYQHRSGRTGRAGREGTVIILVGPRERRELSMLERAVKRKFRHLSPPQPADIQNARLEGLMHNLSNQRPADKEVWHSVAERWLREGNVDAVAGLLAMTLGGAPAQRSLLTGEEGWLTVKISGRILNVPQVVRLLKEAGAGNIGRIQVVDGNGYADLTPQDYESLDEGVLQGFEVTPASEVPPAPAPQGRPRDNRGGGGQKRYRRDNEYRR